MKLKRTGFLNTKIVVGAIKDAFLLLTPQVQFRNPVMFVTYLGAIVTTIYVFTHSPSWFDIQIALWLWFTVLFANFAQAIAESRGKAQAASLRKTKVEAYARQERNGVEIKVPSNKLKMEDIIICEG